MCDIYRIVECRAGSCEEIAFVKGQENAKTYLRISSELANQEPDQDLFYFAIKIQVEE